MAFWDALRGNWFGGGAVELVARVETVCVLLGCFFFCYFTSGRWQTLLWYFGGQVFVCVVVVWSWYFVRELEESFHWDVVSCICMFLWWNKCERFLGVAVSNDWTVTRKVRLMHHIKRLFVAEVSVTLVVLLRMRTMCVALSPALVSVNFKVLTLFCHIVLCFTTMCDTLCWEVFMSGTCGSLSSLWWGRLFGDCGHEVGPLTERVNFLCSGRNCRQKCQEASIVRIEHAFAVDVETQGVFQTCGLTQRITTPEHYEQNVEQEVVLTVTSSRFAETPSPSKTIRIWNLLVKLGMRVSPCFLFCIMNLDWTAERDLPTFVDVTFF